MRSLIIHLITTKNGNQNTERKNCRFRSGIGTRGNTPIETISITMRLNQAKYELNLLM